MEVDCIQLTDVTHDINKPLRLPQDEEKDLKTSNICHIRQDKIILTKVQDHYHIAGKHRGPSQG